MIHEKKLKIQFNLYEKLKAFLVLKKNILCLVDVGRKKEIERKRKHNDYLVA